MCVFSYKTTDSKTKSLGETKLDERFLAKSPGYQLDAEPPAPFIFPQTPCLNMHVSVRKHVLFGLSENRGAGKSHMQMQSNNFPEKELATIFKTSTQMREIAFGRVFPNKVSWTLGLFRPGRGTIKPSLWQNVSYGLNANRPESSKIGRPRRWRYQGQYIYIT